MNFDHEAINVNQLRLPESWMQRHYFVYVMANQEGMFRTGVTANLGRRVYQIQARHVPDFSDSWQYEKLVYFEQYLNVYKAVVREAEIAAMKYESLVGMIRSQNPSLQDLTDQFG